ncbi:asparaginase [Paenibacillus sediminis]|uniref:L-asparaginase II n=1 Tax=Paenibacillus sediminis TaxID=664909 RepID=A0ABS4H3S0_9BACL|nr:asparaginase [Paenibacillus sediminis]MBP1937121.1 L-asparaginase II [Paenibacillus sediminis]
MESILVKEYRGGTLECAHMGHISIVGEDGNIVSSAGDPHFVAFTRSSAKPFQAIPGIRGGIIEHYGLSDQEVAIMAASHAAEPYHIETLESIMAKTGLEENGMICAPSYPLNESARESVIRAQGSKRRVFHNCAGKHLGVLAYSKMKGYSLHDYAGKDHQVQQEILEVLAEMSELQVDQIGLGTDGCGFPVFALPLSALATAYMKLACPDLIEDDATRNAVVRITNAMNRYPELVGGNGRVDTVLLHDHNIVAKGGFKGVFCLGLRKERLGIAFKVLDGSEEEWGWIVQAILGQIGYEHKETIERVRAQFTNRIVNDAGLEVGHAETVFKLV